MRSKICMNSSAVCCERTMRSRSWQLMQPSVAFFWSSVPGKLASHSAFDSWFTSFLVGCRLMSAVAALWSLNFVTDRPDREGILAGCEPRRREAVVAAGIGDDADRHGAARLL